MKSYLMRTAWDAIKGQIFKVVLARLSESNLRQRAAAPAFFEKLEEYLEPWARVFPKAVNFVVVKVALAIITMSSFFALFSEALRQIDMLGRLVPGAFLIGYVTLFVLSVAGFWLVKPPRVERAVSHGEAPISRPADKGAPVARAPMPGMAPFQSPGTNGIQEYSNIEMLRRPTPPSAAEVLLNELRAERDRFRA